MLIELQVRKIKFFLDFLHYEFKYEFHVFLIAFLRALVLYYFYLAK